MTCRAHGEFKVGRALLLGLWTPRPVPFPLPEARLPTLSEPTRHLLPALGPEEPALWVPYALLASAALGTSPPITNWRRAGHPHSRQAGAGHGSASNPLQGTFGSPCMRPCRHGVSVSATPASYCTHSQTPSQSTVL